MKRFISKSVTFGSLVLCCVSFLGFAASAYWLLDLANHFRVQFLIVGGVGFLLALALRLRAAAWIFAATALINAIFIAPLFLKRPDRPKSLIEISIVSYNTWFHNGDWASVLATVREGDPDIVYFTETHPNIQRGVRQIETDFHIFQVDTDILLVRRRAGLNPQLVQTETAGAIPGIPVKLTIAGIEVTVLGIHPAAPINSASAISRDESFAAIASFLENQNGSTIIVGDFNATPWSLPFRVLQERTGLMNSQNGFGIQPTWPSYPGSNFNWLLRIPIDHCFHSPCIWTIDRRVGDHGGSNHSPVFVRLGIQAKHSAAHSLAH